MLVFCWRNVSCPSWFEELSKPRPVQMKRFLGILIIACSCTLLAAAQGRSSYSFDNFDFANGVHIEQPPSPTSKRPARLRKSSKMNENAVTTPPDRNLTQLTSMAVSQSLDGFTTGDAQVDHLIVTSAARNGVDPVLIYAMMHQESS